MPETGAQPGNTRQQSMTRLRLVLELIDRRQLRHGFRQLALCGGEIKLVFVVANTLFGLQTTLLGRGFVEILATNGGVGQNRDRIGLHFEQAAAGVVDLFFTPGQLSAYGTRPQRRSHRCEPCS